MSSQEEMGNHHRHDYSSDRSSEREEDSTSSPPYISQTHRAGQYHPIITTLMTEEEEYSNLQQHKFQKTLAAALDDNFDSNSEQSSGQGAMDIWQLTYNGSTKQTPRGGTVAANLRYKQLIESQISEQ